MIVFEGLGEAMQSIGLWILDLCCKVLGHRWEPVYYPDEARHLEGHYCSRCWQHDYAVVHGNSTNSETGTE